MKNIKNYDMFDLNETDYYYSGGEKWKEKFNSDPVSIQSKTKISVRFVLTRTKSA